MIANVLTILLFPLSLLVAAWMSKRNPRSVSRPRRGSGYPALHEVYPHLIDLPRGPAPGAVVKYDT